MEASKNTDGKVHFGKIGESITETFSNFRERYIEFILSFLSRADLMN